MSEVKRVEGPTLAWYNPHLPYCDNCGAVVDHRDQTILESTCFFCKSPLVKKKEKETT